MRGWGLGTRLVVEEMVSSLSVKQLITFSVDLKEPTSRVGGTLAYDFAASITLQ